MLQSLRIATRESALALWQANHVRQLILDQFPTLDVTVVGMTTEGDRNKTSPLSRIGGKGVFVKELEQALLSGEADIAVHSMKDVPSELPAGLMIGAICERENPTDAFVSNHFASMVALPAGSRVGTSSLRRRLQLQRHFPSLVFPELRGNVDTRLRKLDDGDYEAIVLATAGLTRLGLADRIKAPIDPALCVPAAGQGAVGIECAEDRDDVRAILAAIEHADSALCVHCERMVSSGLGATCNLPIGAYARFDQDDGFLMTAYVSDDIGERQIRCEERGSREAAQEVANGLVTELLTRGGRELVGASGH